MLATRCGHCGAGDAPGSGGAQCCCGAEGKSLHLPVRVGVSELTWENILELGRAWAVCCGSSGQCGRVPVERNRRVAEGRSRLSSPPAVRTGVQLLPVHTPRLVRTYTHGPGTCLPHSHRVRCMVMLVCSLRLFLSLLLHGPHPGGYSLSCPSLSLVPSRSLAQACVLPTRPLGSRTSLERLQGVSKCRPGSCSSGCGDLTSQPPSRALGLSLGGVCAKDPGAAVVNAPPVPFADF